MIERKNHREYKESCHVTESNAGWTFYHLYEEIKEEHQRMTQMGKEQGKA